MRTRTRLHWHEEVDISFKTLDEAKTFWVTKQSFFEARGYVLDPITHSQDTANLRDYSHTNVPICSIGDSADNQDVSIWTFATRVSDNRHVCIKCVGTLSWELLLLKLLHEGANQFDASNHCVPVLEVIRDDERQEISYLVMPALRALGPMSFKTVNDVLEFTSQVLLGLNFMHRKDVGHRDCSMHKIMIDPFEPHAGERQPSLLRRWYKSMKQVATLRPPKQNDLCSTKYYFVGFGGVIDCADEGKQCAIGNYSKDQEPPEFAGPLRLYNPLLLDIFLVGNMLLHDFLDKYSNVDFLEKLIPRMVKCTPGDRENAKAVLRIWLTILPQISSSERRKRLRIRTKPRTERTKRIR